MAAVDASGALILRIVYDGPPEAGKTSSLVSLSELLSREFVSFDTAGGRTLYFDWVEYIAGSYEGLPVRCQVVSAPGQELLIDRRNMLLSEADAVVFVVPANRKDIEDLIRAAHARMSQQGALAPRMIIQLHKQDAPDAIRADALLARLKDLNVSVVGTSVVEAMGIRETFVLAVRLALKRVALLKAQGTLPTAAPLAPQHLLEQLRGISGPQQEARLAATTPSLTADAHPLFLWPAIEGWKMLAEALRNLSAVSRQQNGWWATNDAWRSYSHRFASFETEHEGRHGLMALASQTSRLGGLVSPSRALFLIEDGLGRFRLWEAVKRQRSLRDRLAEALHERDATLLATLLVDSAQRLLDLEKELRAEGCDFPVTLDTSGVLETSTVYTGFSALPATGEVRIEEEFGPAIRDWKPVHAELKRALKRMESAESDVVPELLQCFASAEN